MGFAATDAEPGQGAVSQGKFVEKKYLSVLNKPLESSGTLLFQSPAHLEKHTLLPKAESLVLDQGVLTIENSARNIKRTLVLQEYPAVWAFVESIRSTLAGDLPMLERFYTIKLEGNAGKMAHAIAAARTEDARSRARDCDFRPRQPTDQHRNAANPTVTIRP